jgi:hypothetical protein
MNSGTDAAAARIDRRFQPLESARLTDREDAWRGALTSPPRT